MISAAGRIEVGHDSKVVRRKPNERAERWEALRSGLETALRWLEEGQYLIIAERATGSYFVQFAAQGAEEMLAEAVSNRFLDGWKRLDATAEARLRRLGRRPPVEIGDGPPNWWRQFPAPVEWGEAAELAVGTLSKAFDVALPGHLVYRAFDRSGAEIILPVLGLDREPGAAPEPELAERVAAALRGILEVDEVNYDEDGDVPIRCDDAMVFVRVIPDPGFVAVFSPFLGDVAKSAALLDAVNDMNSEIRFARARVTGRSVTVATEVDPGAGMEASLHRACDAVAYISNHWGARLQERFGGRTFFQEPVEAPPAPAPGLYL